MLGLGDGGVGSGTTRVGGGLTGNCQLIEVQVLQRIFDKVLHRHYVSRVHHGPTHSNTTIHCLEEN